MNWWPKPKALPAQPKAQLHDLPPEGPRRRSIRRHSAQAPRAAGSSRWQQLTISRPEPPCFLPSLPLPTRKASEALDAGEAQPTLPPFVATALLTRLPRRP